MSQEYSRSGNIYESLISENQYEDSESLLNVPLQEIMDKSKSKNYIYRGENKDYKPNPHACSGLYREYKDLIENKKTTLLEIEKLILDRAKSHFDPNTSEIMMLSQMQHYGGITNLVDFSRNLYIALFFACYEEYNSPGYLIFERKDKLVEPKDKLNPIANLTEKEDKEVSKWILSTPSKNNRPIFQSSVFIRYHSGYGKIDDNDTIIIPKDLKVVFLAYLNKHFNIRHDTVYNDLQGFIDNMSSKAIAKLYFEKGNDFMQSQQYDKDQ